MECSECSYMEWINKDWPRCTYNKPNTYLLLSLGNGGSIKPKKECPRKEKKKRMVYIQEN